jgi:hypothetical protein
MSKKKNRWKLMIRETRLSEREEVKKSVKGVIMMNSLKKMMTKKAVITLRTRASRQEKQNNTMTNMSLTSFFCI